MRNLEQDLKEEEENGIGDNSAEKVKHKRLVSELSLQEEMDFRKKILAHSTVFWTEMCTFLVNMDILNFLIYCFVKRKTLRTKVLPLISLYIQKVQGKLARQQHRRMKTEMKMMQKKIFMTFVFLKEPWTM